MIENVLSLLLTAVVIIVIFVLVFVLKTDTLEGILAEILCTDEEEIRKLFRGHTKTWLSSVMMFLLIIGLMSFWIW